MKKLIYSFALIFMLGLTMNTVSAATTKDKVEMTMEEIKAMDKSHMSKAERKELRKELREMKKEARAMGGGVYLSVGAIIIIILLLILIL
jgi:hypothetical protein